jgi:hypothetical protein
MKSFKLTSKNDYFNPSTPQSVVKYNLDIFYAKISLRLKESTTLKQMNLTHSSRF